MKVHATSVVFQFSLGSFATSRLVHYYRSWEQYISSVESAKKFAEQHKKQEETSAALAQAQAKIAELQAALHVMQTQTQQQQQMHIHMQNVQT